MKKNYRKKAIIGVSILLGLLLIGNFGLNFWLRNNLPVYIKNKTPYKISYDKLDVDLVSGNILATKISVKPKNPDDKTKLSIDGTVDSVKVSRFGIIDAVFSKKISVKNLYLARPNLSIILPEKKDKQAKKKSEISAKNIKISNGTLDIFQASGSVFLRVRELGMNVEDLKIDDKADSGNLPFGFDTYSIKAKNFYLRPDNVYAMKADEINTNSKDIIVKNFKLIPLLSFQNYLKFFPEKRNLFDFKSREMRFDDLIFQDNKIAFKHILFTDPDLLMHTTTKNSQEKKKDFTYIVNLDDVQMKNAKIKIVKEDDSHLFSTPKLDLTLNQIRMDNETAKGNIPFQYGKLDIKGQNLLYNSPTQEVAVQNASINEKSGDFRAIVIKPTTSDASKTKINGAINHFSFLINSWKLEKNKLYLDGKNLLVENGNLGIIAGENPTQNQQKNSKESPIENLKFADISLKNIRLDYSKNNAPLSVNGANIHITNLESTGEMLKTGVPFKTGNFTVSSQNVVYAVNRYQKIVLGAIDFRPNNLVINNFQMLPTMSRGEFVRSVPVERDLYTLRAPQIRATGNWDLISKNKFLNISNLQFSGLNADIFRSKIPADDNSRKPMYSEMLRNIKFPLVIANLNINNSRLVYEEETAKSNGAGKLFFGNLNLNAKNVNSAKNGNTKVPIHITCAFMDASPMVVDWAFNTADTADNFTIRGNISNLPAAEINPFLEPYLKIRASGSINQLFFSFGGNKSELNGNMQMKHTDLKVSVLNDEGEKNKLLTAVANLVVKTDSGKFPPSVTVDKVARDNTKSFFNFFWQGIQEGLKKTLVGEFLDKDKSTPKKKNSDPLAKPETKSEQKATAPATGTTEKKPNIFQKIFKKKNSN